MARSYWRGADAIYRAARYNGYIYQATTSSTRRPGKSVAKAVGDADYQSAVTQPFMRTWAFKSVVARDIFVDKFGATRVFSEPEIMEMNRRSGFRE